MATAAALAAGIALPTAAAAAPAHSCVASADPAEVLATPDHLDSLGAAPCAGSMGSAAAHSEAIVAGAGLVILGGGAAVYRRRRHTMTPA